jgi:biotin transport system substrate-specific component
METAVKRRISVYDLVMVGLFAALIAVCAWITVPGTIPFTLQTMGVFLAVGLLGGKRGTAAVLVYILLGAVGMPVFSGFSGGIGRLMGTTGGYIIGFLVSALAMWGMEALFGDRKWVLPASMVLGLVLCYLFGTLWYLALYTGKTGPITFWAVMLKCVVPFIVPDLAKIGIALLLSVKLKRFIRK